MATGSKTDTYWNAQSASYLPRTLSKFGLWAIGINKSLDFGLLTLTSVFGLRLWSLDYLAEKFRSSR